MGRSISVTSCHLSGVRVTGELTYIPAYINAAGKRVNAKCIIPVAANSHKGTHKDKNGQTVDGRTDFFDVVAWGKLADIMARSCPKGKALDLLCKPGSYRGKVFNADGSLRTDAAGTAIEVTRVSFTVIDSPAYGEDSKEQIAREIAEGVRPQYWDQKGHPDFDLWTSILKARQAAVWDGRSNKFGFARVVLPKGQLDFSQPGQQAAPTQQYTQPVQQPQQSMPSMVQHAVNTQAPVVTPANAFGRVNQAQPVTPAPTAPAASSMPGGRIF